MEPDESPLTVKQVAYIFWPDHGVPTNAMSLINFIRRVREVHSLQGTKPILVHCSAGVGRTGTYIVLETMMQMMEEEGFVSILECLKKLRAQRMYAVQTLVSPSSLMIVLYSKYFAYHCISFFHF